MIEEEIDVGIRARFVARHRPEPIKMPDAKLPQLGLMLFQFRYRFVALHTGPGFRFYNQTFNRQYTMNFFVLSDRRASL